MYKLPTLSSAHSNKKQSVSMAEKYQLLHPETACLCMAFMSDVRDIQGLSDTKALA